MNKDLNSQKYTEMAKALYEEALNATIALLKANGKNRYIAIPDWKYYIATHTNEDVFISIWAIGLNDNDQICVKASVDNPGYGCSEDDFPAVWVELTKSGIHPSSYPNFYRFVADNLESATDKDTADNVKWEDDED